MVVKLIPELCIEELSNFSDIVLSMSGGTQSTAIALDLAEQGVEFRMCHHDTGLESKRTREVINRIAEELEVELTIMKPIMSPKEAVMTGFQSIKFAMDREKQGKKFKHDWFKCCNHLKHEPAARFRATLDVDRAITILGFAAYDSFRRGVWLNELRTRTGRCEGNKYEFCHFPKSMKNTIWHCYPLRDHRSKNVMRQFLDDHGFHEVRRSGCQICPIILYKKAVKQDPKCYLRSKKFFMKHFQGHEFCGELKSRTDDLTVFDFLE